MLLKWGDIIAKYFFLQEIEGSIHKWEARKIYFLREKLEQTHSPALGLRCR